MVLFFLKWTLYTTLFHGLSYCGAKLYKTCASILTSVLIVGEFVICASVVQNYTFDSMYLVYRNIQFVRKHKEYETHRQTLDRSDYRSCESA